MRAKPKACVKDEEWRLHFPQFFASPSHFDASSTEFFERHVLPQPVTNTIPSDDDSQDGEKEKRGWVKEYEL